MPTGEYVELPVVPISKESARITSFGSYIPTRTKTAMAAYRHAWEETGLDPFDYPCEVTAVFFPDKVRLWIARTDTGWVSNPRGDLDNLMKTLGDGLNGVAWRDDKLIKHLDIRKARKGER